MTSRIVKAQKMLSNWGVDAIYISHPRDLLYLTGMDLSRGYLFISKKGATLIVDGRYLEACQELRDIDVLLYSKEKMLQTMQEFKGKKLGFDGSEERYIAYIQLKEMTDVAGSTLIALEKPIKEIRSVKEAEEIKKIQAACELGSEGFDFLASLIKEGVTEKELACELEIFWKRQGADGLSFAPIIGFGKNSSKPHYKSGSQRLEKNQPILVDIGVQLDGYCSDMTRMIFFGSVDPKMETICAAVQQAQEAAIAACKPGVFTSELDTIARDSIKQAGFGDYFVHGLGHGVGLDIHEEPIVKKDPSIKDVCLEEGMIITIEPGIYLPHIGGVRIEDMLLVQKQGSLNLTNRPHEALRISC